MNNPNWVRFLLRWGPALILATIIFLLSATPSDEMVDFGSFDLFIKKGAHMAGYGLLALTFLRGVGYQHPYRTVIVLLLVFLYAASDEYHQSFVPGRGASSLDVLIDFTGGILAVFASRLPIVRWLVLLGLK